MAGRTRFWGAMEKLSRADPIEQLNVRRRVASDKWERTFGGPCTLCGLKRSFGQSLLEHQRGTLCLEGQGMKVCKERGLVRAGHVCKWMMGTEIPLIRGDTLHPGLKPHSLWALEWAVSLAEHFDGLIRPKDRERIEDGNPGPRIAQLQELAKHVIAKALVNEKWRKAVMTSFKIAGPKDTLGLLIDAFPPSQNRYTR